MLHAPKGNFLILSSLLRFRHCLECTKNQNRQRNFLKCLFTEKIRILDDFICIWNCNWLTDWLPFIRMFFLFFEHTGMVWGVLYTHIYLHRDYYNVCDALKRNECEAQHTQAMQCVYFTQESSNNTWKVLDKELKLYHIHSHIIEIPQQ